MHGRWTLQAGREHFAHRSVALATPGEGVTFGPSAVVKAGLRVGFVTESARAHSCI